MGKALLKGTVLGAIILYVWMTISWMALPWHCTFMNQFTNESTVASILMENTTKDGVYLLPYGCHESMEKETELMKKGPIVFASIQKRGFDVTSPRPYVVSFIILLIGAFLVTYLLTQMKPASYFKRVGFVTLFGVAAGVVCAFPDWNWWGFSFGYVCVEFLDFVIAWFLAGLGIAAVVKRTPA